MRIICRKGFYKFYMDNPNELVLFGERYGAELVQIDDYWTFPTLDLCDYSIENQPLAGLPAIITYAGRPQDVFAENQLIYNVKSDKVIRGIRQGEIGERADGYNWIVTGIPQAYGTLSDGTRISGFNGWMDLVKGYTIVNRWENADI